MKVKMAGNTEALYYLTHDAAVSATSKCLDICGSYNCHTVDVRVGWGGPPSLYSQAVGLSVLGLFRFPLCQALTPHTHSSFFLIKIL